jgi:hypothetical protein
MLFNNVDFSNPQESYPSCHALFILFYILINHIIQQNGLLQPARVISILPCEDIVYFLMGMFYLFYLTLINHVIQQNGLLQPARVISILPCEDVVYFLMGMVY